MSGRTRRHVRISLRPTARAIRVVSGPRQISVSAGVSLISQSGPGARASRWSAVSRTVPSGSADATYAASYTVMLSRSSQHRRSRWRCGARWKAWPAGRPERARHGGRREHGSRVVAVWPVIGQCHGDDAGVNDDHGRHARQLPQRRTKQPGLRCTAGRAARECAVLEPVARWQRLGWAESRCAAELPTFKRSDALVSRLTCAQLTQLAALADERPGALHRPPGRRPKSTQGPV
jgi:hypothetical protein